MRIPTKRAAPLLLLLAACGTDHAADTGPGEEQPGLRTITGSEVNVYRALDGTVLDEIPDDLHDVVIEAHFPDGTVVPGYGLRDGTFAIPDAPAGSYWLRISRRPFGQDFLWTDADELDFGADSLAPWEPLRTEVQPSLLSFHGDGLAPWSEGDWVSFYGPDDVVFVNDLVSEAVEGAPAPGDTSLDGLTVDWIGRPICNFAEGETAFVIQFAGGQNDQGVAYHAPARSFVPAPMQQEDGVPAEVNGTFAEPEAIEFRLAWDRDAFDALRPSIHPSRTGAADAHGFTLSANPGAREKELWFAPEYTLFLLDDPSVLEGTGLLDLGTFHVPNPYPRSWVGASFIAEYPVEVPFPDDALDQPLFATVGVRSRTLPTEAVKPTMGPVQGIRLDGADASGDLQGVSATPEISLSPPALGTPNVYLVQIARAEASPPEPYRPGWYLEANLWLPGDVTSARIPADLLRSGETYSIIVRAMDAPGLELRTAPFRPTVEAAWADAVSGAFTVR